MGRVVGDGISSVRRLVDELNADPRRANRRTSEMKKLEFDEEAIEHLAEQGINGDTVPAKGQIVRLRGAANMARGGIAVPVMDRTHPDNRRLSELAAEALRVDLAGIDLIISDITRSWREVGAGIW